MEKWSIVKSQIPSTKSQGVRCQGGETQKLKPETLVIALCALLPRTADHGQLT